jgi:hypothetical protein
MAKPRFPADLREFLKLLHSGRVEYLLIGGYAVAYYGYQRATGDLGVRGERPAVRVLTL